MEEAETMSDPKKPFGWVDEVEAQMRKELLSRPAPLDLRAVEARLDSYEDEPTEYVLPVFARDLRALLAALRETRATLAKAQEALIWTSAADDFAPSPQGKARLGWLKIAQPTIDAAAAVLASVRDE